MTVTTQIALGQRLCAADKFDANDHRSLRPPSLAHSVTLGSEQTGNPSTRSLLHCVQERMENVLMGANGRGALAENPEVARAVGERDRERRERPHCLPAILSWNQF